MSTITIRQTIIDDQLEKTRQKADPVHTREFMSPDLSIVHPYDFLMQTSATDNSGTTPCQTPRELSPPYRVLVALLVALSHNSCLLLTLFPFLRRPRLDSRHHFFFGDKMINTF